MAQDNSRHLYTVQFAQKIEHYSTRIWSLRRQASKRQPLKYELAFTLYYCITISFNGN